MLADGTDTLCLDRASMKMNPHILLRCFQVPLSVLLVNGRCRREEEGGCCRRSGPVVKRVLPGHPRAVVYMGPY